MAATPLTTQHPTTTEELNARVAALEHEHGIHIVTTPGQDSPGLAWNLSPTLADMAAALRDLHQARAAQLQHCAETGITLVASGPTCVPDPPAYTLPAYIIRLIESERRYQIVKDSAHWGHPGRLSLTESLLLVGHYADRVRAQWCDQVGDEAALVELRKLLGIIVRALEAHPAPLRHP